MLSFLPAPLLGVISFIFFTLNLVLWATPLYLVILVKLLVPAGPLRDRISRFASSIAQQWAYCNTLYCDAAMKAEWDVRMPAGVSAEGQYLVCSNHQSWNDIYVVMKAFGKRAPFFKFFLKQELIWVPILGLCWWGLDFPFMKRYTPEQVAANPALKGKDLETTRKACERYRNVPALILNFLEGTRFTRAKHAKQQSPYQHLLKPKSGGFAFSISALGERINSLLDVTIVYPEGAKGFGDLLMGRVHKVIVEVRQLTIPHEFYSGSYESDAVFRKRFQEWIAEIWAQKDLRISQLLAEAGVAPGRASVT